MMNCSYGNAYRLAPADSVRQALVQTSDNLCSRFDPDHRFYSFLGLKVEFPCNH